MKKFVLNKGKLGYDFSTLSDKPESVMDIAWFQAQLELSTDYGKAGPFTWWATKAAQLGENKWYVVELDINPVQKPAVEG